LHVFISHKVVRSQGRNGLHNKHKMVAEICETRLCRDFSTKSLATVLKPLLT
jgi:hypothetical protein